MNLHLFARVLWRFKYLVGVGFVVALLLSVLTVAKLPSLAPRTPLIYSSSATLLVTQSGFPLGSAIQQYAPSDDGQAPVPAGDIARLTTLANLYVQIANSDVIGRLVAARVPGGKISATQNYSFSPGFYSTALPILTIAGTGSSPVNALATTHAGVAVLTGYLKKQQRVAGIDDADRVVVQELQQPRKTTVLNPTKKTLPLVVFMTVMLAVTGLAFVLENLRPRVPLAVVKGADAEPLNHRARRSA